MVAKIRGVQSLEELKTQVSGGNFQVTHAYIMSVG